MNNQKAACSNAAQVQKVSYLNLPIERWETVFNFLTKAELGRVRRSCWEFYDVGEICMTHLVFRELKTQENPLNYIQTAYPMRRVIDFFYYYMRHAVLTEELINKVKLEPLVEVEKIEKHSSCALALCDMLSPDENDQILKKNIELLNTSFQENRSYHYWNFWAEMIKSKKYDDSLLCIYFSLCCDALTRSHKERRAMIYSNVIEKFSTKSLKTMSELLEVNLTEFLVQLSMKKRKCFLNLLIPITSGTPWWLGFHSEQLVRVLSAIDKLTAYKKESQAAMAISCTIIARQYSNEALKDYLPLLVSLMKNSKQPSCAFDACRISRQVLSRRNALLPVNQVTLMYLLEKAVKADEQCYLFCRDFFSSKAISLAIKERLINLTNICINSEDHHIAADAISDKLTFEGCHIDNMTLCLPILKKMNGLVLYRPLRTILKSQGYTFNHTIRQQIIQLTNNLLETPGYSFSDIEEELKIFLEREQRAASIEWMISCVTSKPALIVYFLLLIWGLTN